MRNSAGYLIQYDWSGKHIVSSKKIQIHLRLDDQEITGKWIEDGVKDTVSIFAVLSSDSVLFKHTLYYRKDHYSPDNGILYNFENASLRLVQKADSVFLAGNILMFSPDRKEPSKPLFIALSRKDSLLNVNQFKFKAYPNPFQNILNAEFELPQPKYVEIEILDLNGTVLYRNTAGALGAGQYKLPIQGGHIAVGTYVLKLIIDNKASILKVIKQK